MPGSNAALEVRGLTRHFGGLAALDSVSFSLDPGQILGVIGPNGSGKTTLVNLITGMDRPDAGEVLFFGASVNKLPAFRRGRLGIARTFQVVKPLAGMTVRENAMVGALFGADGHRRNFEAAGREADAALDRVGLAAKHAWPIDALTLADRKALELARALATSPRVLLLDEVMAGLNHAEIAGKVELLRDLKQQGLTVLVIEHVMKVVMALSDRIVVLHHGQKIADGRPAEVAQDPSVVRAYLGHRYAEPAVR